MIVLAIADWFIWIVIAMVVILAPVSILLMRTIAGRQMRSWLEEFPARPPRPEATWQMPGHMTIGDMSGNVYRVAKDDEFLHLAPMQPIGWLMGMPGRSIPWSEVEVTRTEGGQADALLGGLAYHGPSWVVMKNAEAL